MTLLKWFKFEVEKDGRRKVRCISSKHLNGAVRKLYQEYEFDNIVRIL